MADVAVVTLGEMVAVWVNVGVLVVVGGSVTLFLLGLMGMSLGDPSEGAWVKLGGYLGVLGLAVSVPAGALVAALAAWDRDPGASGYRASGWGVWLGIVLGSHLLFFTWLGLLATVRHLRDRNQPWSSGR